MRFACVYRTVSRRLRVLIPGAVLLLALPGVGSAQTPSTSAAAERHIATLFNTEADQQARLDAVHALLDRSDQSTIVSLGARLIATTDDQTGSRAILLSAIADHAAPPSSLVTHIKAGAGLDDPGAAIPAIRALGSYHDRETVRWLFDLAVSEDAVRRHAFEALGNAAVRQDLGQNQAGWMRWFEVVDQLTESEWNRGLIARLDAERFRNRSRINAMTDRLVAAYRDLVLNSEPEPRTVLLASLLLDQVPALRDLGFELINRELAESRQLGQPVSDAAIRLLANPDARVRTAAAGLVNQLAPNEAKHAVVVALLSETDADAAAALLVAAARWPDERAAAPAVNWLELRPDLAQTATQTLDVLLRAGMLDTQWHARILAVLREIDAGSCNASCLRLLVALGDSTDWESVGGVLLDQSNPLRTAAAEALLTRTETMPLVIDAAANAPELFDITWRAMAGADPTADDYRTVLALPAPDEDSRQQALDQIAAVMTIDHIMALALETSDAHERVRLLRPRLLDTSTGSQRNSTLVLLAETELEVNSPGGAIAALDQIDDVPDHPLRARAGNARVRALILLGRADEAEPIDVDAQIWIDTVIEHADLKDITDVIAIIERRFPDLTDAQLQTIDTVRLAGAVEPDDIDSPAPTPPDP